MGNGERVELPRVLSRLVCAGLIGSLLAGCGSDRTISPIDGPHRNSSKDPAAVMPDRELDIKGAIEEDTRSEIDDSAIFGLTEANAQFDVDPALGGSFDAGRVTVSIPRDALYEPITLEISEKNSNSMAVIGELLPHGQVFQRPVTLSFDLRGTPAEDWEDACIFWFDDENGAWVGIGGTHDPNTHVLSVKLEHFSHYGVGRAGWFQKPPPPLVQEPAGDTPEAGSP